MNHPTDRLYTGQYLSGPGQRAEKNKVIVFMKHKPDVTYVNSVHGPGATHRVMVSKIEVQMSPMGVRSTICDSEGESSVIGRNSTPVLDSNHGKLLGLREVGLLCSSVRLNVLS
eukprot:m.312282 g.312282  ORF g.312282 m.312282 type:complete len:114 (-) comp16401_c0_seq12:4664-5005(-)